MECPNCQRPLPSPPGEACVHCGMALAPPPGVAPSPDGQVAAGLDVQPGAVPAAATPGGAGAAVTPGGAIATADRVRPTGARGATRAARDPLIGTDVAGRYRVEELIGQGGMGKVYRARHLALDKVVCLKTLKPALLEDPTLVGRFEREAKAASRLNHPNVIGVLDFGRTGDEGTLYIAMEFVQGKDLRLVLRDEWPLPEERLVHIMAQVLAALSEAHSHAVIHRDLKPENIMVEQRRDAPDFVKVLDFGIAKILDSDMPGLTRSDVVCGTPQYMAPEQATGSALDERCDLYAVGVILYQLATGQLPFDGQNSMEVLTKHVNEPAVPPRQGRPDAPISAAMEKLILRALEKEPAARPQTAEEFRQLLLAIPAQAAAERVAQPAAAPAAGAVQPEVPTEDEVEPAAPPSPPEATPPPPAARRRAPLYAAGALALAVALAVALAAVVLKPGRPRPGSVPVANGAVGPAPAGPVGARPGAPAPARDPEKAAALVKQSSQLQVDGDTGAARDLLEEAVLLDPDNAEAHFRLARLFHLTQPQRAREEYERARRLNPGKYAEQVQMALGTIQ